MDIKFETKPAFTVVGMKYQGQNQDNEIPTLWGQFMPRVSEIKRTNGLCFGMCSNFDETNKSFDYLASVEVTSDETLPADMEQWAVPENTYAVFTATMPTLHQTYDDIYQTHLVQAGLNRAEGPEFELYLEDFDPADPNAPIYLYIPVNK